MEVSKGIESGSVDLILTDLPYGNMKNAPSTWDASKTAWDTVIIPEDIFSISDRILRKNGKLVLFSQEPYTTNLISNAIPNLPFSYRATWEKDTFANHLGAKKAMVSFTEDILVFSKIGGLERSGVNANHPLKDFFNDALSQSGRSKKFVIGLVGSSASHYFTDGMQFRVPTIEKFNVISEYIDIGFNYEEIKDIDNEYKRIQTTEHYASYPTVFNLWEGGKYKSNILTYKKDYNGYHPTQKPVLLLEDLIKTYSNEGDTVVDLTCGSGSTCIAAINTKRDYIGIEMDEGYCKVAQDRVIETIESRNTDK